MSGNVPTSMDVEDPKKTPKVSKIEELNTQREEFRKDSESLILEQLQRKAEMLEDKAAKASAKAKFARTYYENEKRLIEKTTYQQRKKGKSILKKQRERLIQLHRAERDRKILARDTAEDLRKREEDE